MKERILDIEQRIQAACDRVGRDRREVTLIAVSKTKPIALLEEAYELGMTNFGENKVQELDLKYHKLIDKYGTNIEWHLIGHLQRNKVKQVIGKTMLIHSVDSLRLGLAIEEEASKMDILCDILVEVNIADEETKYGISQTELLPLIKELVKLPHIRVRGLMAIAPYVEDSEKNRKHFRKLYELFIDIKSKNIDNELKGKHVQNHNLNNNEIPLEKHTQHHNLNNNEIPLGNYFDTLSMGMTGDFEIAIEEGSTMVRIGTGIFGERDYTIVNN